MRSKFFSVFITGMMISLQLLAQNANRYIGTWEGTLNVGVELRAVFHIKFSGSGGLMATTDSPDQGSYGITCDSTFITENGLTIIMRELNATYTGKLINDSTISGTLTQMAAFPLVLKKSDKEPVERKRPQVPQAPFPYESYEVEYDNADKSVHLGATLTVPKPDPNIRYIKAPEYPVAILITGSGQQDRDESIMGHKPFLVIADHLSRMGYAVLRVDDRGMGKSKGDMIKATSEDFGKDVEAGIEYLKTRHDINKNKIGLIGHSEGGMIAPIIASRRNDINFIILLAGPGIKIIDLMGEQNAAILRSEGMNETTIKSFVPLYKNILMTLVRGTDSTTSVNNALKIVTKWSAKTDKKIKDELGFKDEKAMKKYVHDLYPVMTSPWFRYFILFDPQPYLRKLNTKVLALNGSRDVQVIAPSNLAGIERSIKKSKVTVFEKREMEGLNHLFQHCKKCTVSEYGEIEETFSPGVLKIMSDWLDKNVK